MIYYTFFSRHVILTDPIIQIEYVLSRYVSFIVISSPFSSAFSQFKGSNPPSKGLEFRLVGGFNPFENISQIGSFPQIGVKINKYLKPPPSRLHSVHIQ